MFKYEWENKEIAVSLAPDTTFKTLNVEQRSAAPTKKDIQEIVRDQKRFQMLQIDKRDIKDLIKGKIQFYELHIEVSGQELENSLSFFAPSKLLSTTPEEQEEEIAWLIDETGILEHIETHLKYELENS